MNSGIAGFSIHAAGPNEAAGIFSLFPTLNFGAQSQLLYAAGSPGNQILGALSVQPTQKGSAGFRLAVHPDFRRRGIGRRLVEHLYQFAIKMGAPRLSLLELVHEDLPANAFYRAMGLSPSATLATHVLDLHRDVVRICAPIVRRFMASPLSSRTQLLTLDALNPNDVADFVARNYHGWAELTEAQLKANRFDPWISLVARQEGKIAALTLCRSQPGVSSIFMDMILAAPDVRPSALPIILAGNVARRALSAGKTQGVFEADQAHDHFAIGFAKRSNAAPGHKRFRYAIDATAMRTHLERQNQQAQ